MMASWTSAALAVMEELMRHPITHSFTGAPPRQEPPESDHYLSILTHPQDLTTIAGRLRSGEYRSINDWLDDVEMTWKNSELPRHTQVQHVVADECRRIFRKVLRTNGLYPVQSWCRDVREILNRIHDQLVEIPAKHRKFLTDETKKDRAGTKIPRSEAVALSRALNLTLEDEAIEVLFIIRDGEQRREYGHTELMVDLAELKPSTFVMVKSYVEGVLAKRGVPYPEIQE